MAFEETRARHLAQLQAIVAAGVAAGYWVHAPDMKPHPDTGQPDPWGVGYRNEDARTRVADAEGNHFALACGWQKANRCTARLMSYSAGGFKDSPKPDYEAGVASDAAPAKCAKALHRRVIGNPEAIATARAMRAKVAGYIATRDALAAVVREVEKTGYRIGHHTHPAGAELPEGTLGDVQMSRYKSPELRVTSNGRVELSRGAYVSTGNLPALLALLLPSY
jgi:hypothetical protein